MNRTMDNKKTSKFRQWDLLRLLTSSPSGYCVDDLSRQLNVSTRTIRRDLCIMRDAGIRISEQTAEFGRKFWLFTAPDGGKITNLSYDEAVALYVGRQFLEPMTGSILWEAVNSGLDKIRDSLGPRALFFFERLENEIHQTHVGWSSYKEKARYIDEILIGIEESRVVQIRYRSLNSEKSETYTIEPYCTIMHHGTLYVIGYSHKSDGIRNWKVDRVEDALALDRRFEKNPTFSIAKYTEEMFAVYHSQEDIKQKIRIRFDSQVARYVGEHRWNSTQRITREKDGCVILELELNNTVELKSWLLGFGSHAVALEPESLRNDIIAGLKRSLENYQG